MKRKNAFFTNSCSNVAIDILNRRPKGAAAGETLWIDIICPMWRNFFREKNANFSSSWVLECKRTLADVYFKVNRSRDQKLEKFAFFSIKKFSHMGQMSIQRVSPSASSIINFVWVKSFMYLWIQGAMSSNATNLCIILIGVRSCDRHS